MERVRTGNMNAPGWATHFTHKPVLLDIMLLRLFIGEFCREKVDNGGENTPPENNKGCRKAPEAACVKRDRIPIGIRAGDMMVATRPVERDVLLR
jgi:hypothetical protein